MKINGMWTDGSPLNNPKGTSRNNKNIVLTESLGSVTNEKGFSIYCTNYLNKKNIGKIELLNDEFILFSITDDLSSEIGIVINGVYSKILKHEDLNFNINTPIHGEFQINDKGERIIVWVGTGFPKILNIDNIPTPFDINKLNIFNTSVTPSIISEIISDGGSLLTGAYYPIILFEREDYSTSNWFKHYLPIYITDKSDGLNYDNNEGCLSGLLSNKSIILKISNIDVNYKTIIVGFIYQKDGIKTPYIVNKTKITSNEQTIILNTFDTLETLDLKEVIVDKANYSDAKLITQSDQTLFLGDLKSDKEPNQQSIVNNIRLKWHSEKIDILKTSFKNHNLNNKKRHFAHGEVYNFFIQFEYEKIGWGKNYILNGRLPITTDLELVTVTDQSLNNINFKKFQVEDTCELITSNSTSATGHFGYWENESEEYPLEGNFPIGKVRHFRFPSLQWMKNNVWTQDSYGTNESDILGIKLENLDLNTITDCQGNKALKYRISFAKRKNSNNSIVGQSIVLTKEGVNFYYNENSGGAIVPYYYKPRNRVKDASFSPTVDNYDPVRTYPFELLKTKNSANVNYYRKEYELVSSKIIQELSNAEEIIASFPGFGTTGFSHIGQRQGQVVIDYIDTNSVIPKTNSVSSAVQGINIKYIPNNIKLPSLDNLLLEEFVELEGVLAKTQLDDNVSFYDPLTTISEKTYLITLLNIQRNYYLNFYNQDLVYLNTNTSIDNPLFGGDTYICDYCINTLGNKYQDTSLDVTESGKDNRINGLRVARRFLVESVYNINLRNVVLSTDLGYTQYYPMNGYHYLNLIQRDKTVNNFTIGYNKDFNALNEITFYQIWKGIDTDAYNYPYRIIKGQKFDNESNVNYWREFKKDDYFETVKNKGKLINLESGNDYIYIHHEKALYKTKGRTRALSSDSGENIYTGLGDIFDFPPVPILHDKLGQLGTQHKFSCSLTKYGYIFYDAEKGKWFMVSDTVKIISDNGKEKFFLNNKNCYSDNPYQGCSIQFVFDEEFNRFLVNRNFKELKDYTRFKGVWRNDTFFINSLVSGDIVYKDDKFKVVQ